ncbi:RNA-binding S4 domain-containing protein [Streptomyces griseorubiginosus]|uniref:RNA-binding S4 domain-containing protein n=1 Tax=Streptomyces griseorubiginosus TaxID=67304 RepID=UPI0033BABAA7
MAVERTDDNEAGAVAPHAVTPEAVAPDAPDPKVVAAIAAAEAAGPQSGETVRTDSWIWSVRLVKTRSAGATACRGGHVQVNGERVKPAHSLRVGDEVRVRQEGRERIVVVKRLIRKRVGAPVAAQCYVDNSPPPPPREAFAPAGLRDRGAGRPTKRDRRELERLRGLAEGNRRGRFAGPSGLSGADDSTDSGEPGGPYGSDSPGGSGSYDRSDRARRSDKGGRSGRTRRSG